MDLLTTSFICWLYWACCTKHTSKNLKCKRSCKVCFKKRLKYMMFFLSTYHKQRSLKSGKAPLHRKRMNANEMYLLLCKYCHVIFAPLQKSSCKKACSPNYLVNVKGSHLEIFLGLFFVLRVLVGMIPVWKLIDDPKPFIPLSPKPWDAAAQKV